MQGPLSVSFFVMSMLLIAPGVRGQSLDWAVRGGGLGVDAAQAVGVDDSGNSYVVGMFNTQATFGAGGTNETILTSAGNVVSQDVFVAKYNAAGVLQWARGIGGTDPASGGDAGTDLGEGIAVDGAGNSYVTGSLWRFTSFADFGSGVTLITPGVFVAKYDPDGNALWATSVNTNGIAFAIAVDATGNTYVTGDAPDPQLGGSIPTVWKLDSNGNVLWTRQAPGDGGRGLAISVDSGGASYVAGRFGGSTTFGREETTETVLTSGNGTGEGFVAKYDSLGNLVWATQSLSDTGSWVEGIDTDGDWNSYVTGTLNGSTTFGADEPNETTLVAQHVGDMFLAKYDSAGQLLWVEHGPGNFNASGLAVSVDEQANSYVAGFFGTSLTLGVGQPNEVTLFGLGGGDVFVAKFDADGVLQWARQDGGAGEPSGDWGNGIAVDAGGNAYVAGFFQSSATFGGGEPNETTLVSDGQTDAFVARYLNDAAPPLGLDLDIARFRVTGRVDLSRGRLASITLAVRNNGPVAGEADATVVGIQNDLEVYRETLPVSDPAGGRATAFDFPDFAPAVAGDISWTVTIGDQDPDVDTGSDVTTVVP